ncbi:Xenotropic and polytropic retrovirus receptor 1 [Savitreella phatthalungensis]
MKFAKQLDAGAVNEWRSAYFDYKKGKKLIKRVELSRSNTRDTVTLETSTLLDNHESSALFGDEHNTVAVFEGFLKSEMARIDEFYCRKEADAARRLGEIRVQLREMRDLRDVFKQARTSVEVVERPQSAHIVAIWDRLKADIRSALEYADSDLIDRYPLRDNSPNATSTQLSINYRIVRRRIRLAMKEFYHSLELLASYQALNQTAITKVLKKFEKAARIPLKTAYLDYFHSKTSVGQSEETEHLIRETETLYTDNFFSSRKHALTSLRMHERTEDSRFTLLRIGLCLGASLPLLLEGIVKSEASASLGSGLTRSFLLQIWAGFFFLLLASLLFGVNCFLWDRSKINYVFIFEFDINHNLTWYQYLELPSILLLIYALLFWMNCSDFFPTFATWYPVVFTVATASLLLLPLKVGHRSSRKWLGFAILRLLLSGLVTVRFQDVFLGDLLNSLTYSAGNISLFFCTYTQHWNGLLQCGSSRSRLFGFFTTLPGIIRLLHSLRRYKDTRHWFPHALNAAKYSFTILTYTFLSVWRIERTSTHRALFILFACINSCFTSGWDLIMDTSLLQRGSKHWLLRDQLAFRETWPYYFFLFSDPVLRCSWIFYVIFQNDMQHAATVSFFIALVEILRRSMWSSFRVENEHVSNVINYRATRELPLPFAIGASHFVAGTGTDMAPVEAHQGIEHSQTQQPTVSQAHATDFSRKSTRSMRSALAASVEDSDDDDGDVE